MGRQRIVDGLGGAGLQQLPMGYQNSQRIIPVFHWPPFQHKREAKSSGL